MGWGASERRSRMRLGVGVEGASGRKRRKSSGARQIDVAAGRPFPWLQEIK